MGDKWIRASEINDYIYCQRAWWLKRVDNYAPENVHELVEGTAYHREHGRIARRATLTQRLAYALIFITVSFIVFTLLTSLAIS
ncbi:MAG: hypothetical protein KC415_16810 [Anaerolineales bacterium]|nr:hypothetical protein [Anaerolineales bacterium]MCB8991745.1 hypothetical protein [Ardenticatenaceae bacterium]